MTHPTPGAGTQSAPSDVRGFFEEYGPFVYARALHILGNAADAQEATQEVFVRVMRGLDRFEGRSHPRAWLRSITTNYCINQLRNWKRRRELLEEHVARQPAPEPESAAVRRRLLVQELLAEVDEAQAKAAWYVFVDGLSHRETADRMGVSRRTVGNLVERFRERAAALLAASSPELPAQPRRS